MDEQGCSGWQFFNPFCQAGQGVKVITSGAIQEFANATMEAFGKAIASVGTFWVQIGTPNLTGTGAQSSAIQAGEAPPNSQAIETVMGYVMWICLGIAILSLMVLGAIIATRMRSGDGIAAVGRVGLILGSVVLISGASALVSGLMPAGPVGAGGAVLFVQSGLWWLAGAIAIASVIIGGAKMAWQQRAEPGRETLQGIITLVVVAGAGTAIVALLVAAADSFSGWFLDRALTCDISADQACFGRGMAHLLVLGSNPSTAGLGALLVIVLGLVAVIASIIQIVIMVARAGMLVILTGILPVSASFTNTETGKTWFRRNVGWLVAFILYKPAAAIVYATAFQLAGTDIFKDDGSGVIAVVSGLMLMVIALAAMPALMKFVTPAVGALAGGATGALAMGAMMALPSGASMLGRLASGSGGGESNDGLSGPSGQPGPSGSDTAPPRGGSNDTAPNGGGPGTSGDPGGGNDTSVPTGSGAGTPAGPGGGAATGAGAGASGAGAATGAGAGGAAASGAAAGATGGLSLAAEGAIETGKAAKVMAQGVADDAIGEGSGS